MSEEVAKMKFERLMFFLDKDAYEEFVIFYNSFNNNIFYEFLKAIIDLKDIDKVYKSLDFFAQYIFLEKQGRHLGEIKRFEFDKDMEYFQEFLYLLNFFTVAKVPFPKWKGLLELVLEIIKDLVYAKDFNYKKHPKFKDFLNEKEKIISEIRKDPEMDRKYFDFLNGAL